VAIEAIRFSISGADISTIPSTWLALSKMVGTKFINNTSNEIRIETSLLILSSLAYTIPKRKDLMDEVRLLIMQNL